MPNDSIAIQLDREDVILLLLEANERLLGKDSISGITRLEKLLFLLEEQTDFEGIAEFYHFEPHNFGPFSKEVYEAVEFLEGCGLIEIGQKAYLSFYASSDEAKLLSEISESDVPQELARQDVQTTEKLFCLTQDGMTVAGKLRQAVTASRSADTEALDGIILRYGNWPLNQLIRYVYRRYPQMTVKSIHPEARRLLH